MGPPPTPAGGKVPLSPEKATADLSQLDEKTAKKVKQMIDTNAEYWKCYPRIMVDITYALYARTVLHSVVPPLCPSPEASRKSIAKKMNPSAADSVIVTLSVRTFTDCLFRALALPEGSEILMSGITIPHMVDIVRHHKLVSRPFDIEIDTFTPDLEQCKRMITPRTKVLLVAPLFGRTMRKLAELKQIAKENNLLFVVDAAQAFGIKEHAIDIDADVTMFSFGFIKFSTALGGCVGWVKDPTLRKKVAAVEASLPVRPHTRQLFNMVKAVPVLFVDEPLMYGFVRRLAENVGVDTSHVVHTFTRGFPGPDLMPLIRFRPHPATLATLDAQVTPNPKEEAKKRFARAASGWHFMSYLPPYVQCVSAGETTKPLDSTFWLSAFVMRNPLAVCQIFHQHGLDSSLGASQMAAVGTEAETPVAHAVLKNLLYIPLSDHIGEEGRQKVIELFKKIPREIIESPLPSFHKYVASRPEKHAYRSKEVAEFLKKRPKFEDPPSVLVPLAAGQVLGAALLLAKL